MKIKLSYDQILFLAAYFRHLDLSLDRARWEGLVGLRQYYQNHLDPREVLDWDLWREVVALTDNWTPRTKAKALEKNLDRIRLKIGRMLGDYSVKVEVLKAAHDALKCAAEMIFDDQDEFSSGHELARSKVLDVVYPFLEPIISCSDVARYTSVEHYWEAYPDKNTSLRWLWEKARKPE